MSKKSKLRKASKGYIKVTDSTNKTFTISQEEIMAKIREMGYE